MRNCTTCSNPTNSDKNKLCSECKVEFDKKIKAEKQQKQIEKSKLAKQKSIEKLKSKEIDIESFKVKNVAIKPKKIVKSQKELEKEKKKKLAIKAEKDRLKRKAKREEITVKKVDQLQSKVIRSVYPLVCSTCGFKGELKDFHNGHVFSRKFIIIRFNPQNCAPQCPKCNIFGNGEQYLFSKFVEQFHGEGTMDKLHSLLQSKEKISKPEREAIYKVYQNALEHKNLNKLIEEYYKIFEE